MDTIWAGQTRKCGISETASRAVLGTCRVRQGGHIKVLQLSTGPEMNDLLDDLPSK